MDGLINLKFDDKTMDTRLAEDYLREDDEFKPFGCDIEAYQEIIPLGRFNYKMYYIDEVCGLVGVARNSDTVSTAQGRALARKIEENIDLFAQLEYLIRKIPIDEAKIHVGLIVQQFRCNDIMDTAGNISRDMFLIMSENMPLFYLGCVVLNCIKAGNTIYLISTIKTAAVCRLFAELCHQVGLKIILLFLRDSTVHELKYRNTIRIIDMNTAEELNSGCTGIITERSDLDSAVDVFLSSTRTSPWKLRRLLIQESVYESFKEVVTWKCNLFRNKTGNDQQEIDSYRRFSTDVFPIDGKIFLLDYVGPTPEAADVVIVEAYRTTKELLTLLKTYNSHYLSVWSSDASEYNEIALAATSPAIWVNDYGSFRGPPAASNCIYASIYTNLCFEYVEVSKEIEKLNDLLESWMKMDFEERVEIMIGALNKFIDKAVKGAYLDIGIKLLDDVYNSQSNAFFDYTNGRMCVGMKRCTGVMMFTCIDIKNITKILTSVLYGNAIGIATKSYEPLVETLKNDGIPIVICDVWPNNNKKKWFVYDPITIYNYKIIWSNYGTIFAN